MVFASCLQPEVNQLIPWLSETGIDLHQKGGWRFFFDQPLPFCARSGNISAVKAFLKLRLIDPRVIETSIALACESGHADIIELLSNEGILKEMKGRLKNKSLLPMASASGNLKLLRLLLDLNLDPNEKNGFGLTALHYASRAGSIEIADVLLKSGANINTLATSDGIFKWQNPSTPFHKAKKENQEEMIDWLQQQPGFKEPPATISKLPNNTIMAIVWCVNSILEVVVFEKYDKLRGSNIALCCFGIVSLMQLIAIFIPLLKNYLTFKPFEKSLNSEQARSLAIPLLSSAAQEASLKTPLLLGEEKSAV